MLCAQAAAAQTLRQHAALPHFKPTCMFCLCACLRVHACECTRGVLGCGLALLEFRNDLRTLAALETCFQFVEGNDAGACVSVRENLCLFERQREKRGFSFVSPPLLRRARRRAARCKSFCHPVVSGAGGKQQHESSWGWSFTCLG